MRKSLLFPFYGKDGEDRTRDLTVHKLTSCLRRHCEEVDRKMLRTKKTARFFLLLNSFSHHTAVRKRGISVENIPQLMLPRSSYGHIPVPLKGCCLAVGSVYMLPINTPIMGILFNTVC